MLLKKEPVRIRTVDYGSIKFDYECDAYGCPISWDDYAARRDAAFREAGFEPSTFMNSVVIPVIQNLWRHVRGRG